MTEKDFSEFFEQEVNACRVILTAKNKDYSSGNDKLANFKEAAKIDNVTPIEALRGMDLKHRTSIQSVLMELSLGICDRSLPWWQEKIRDHINYTFLLHALIYETYFQEKK